MKFGRIYQMTAEGREATHQIAFPLTARFRITNTSLFGGGSAFFQIYNLTQDVRNDLYKDTYEIRVYKGIAFAAGYSLDNAAPGTIELPVAFKGNIIQASSYRQGPDWVTEIVAYDGIFGKENGSINLTKPAPYSFEDVLREAVRAMPRVSLGVIGAFDVARAAPARGITFSGNPWDLINRQVLPILGQAVIVKEKVSIVQQWEYLEDVGGVSVISDETGLLGTPRLQDALIKARMLFEPRVEIMQKITLQTHETRMNGDYKVVHIEHGGTISGAVGEDLTTDVTLFNPNRILVAA